MNEETLVTLDIESFGSREFALVAELFNAKMLQGFPDGFDTEGLSLNFNKSSECVFFSNGEYQVAMMNGPVFELWFSCPNCGHEGFREECVLTEEGCNECDDEGDHNE